MENASVIDSYFCQQNLEGTTRKEIEMNEAESRTTTSIM